MHLGRYSWIRTNLLIFYECLLFFNFHLCASTTLGVRCLPGLIFVQKKFEKVRCISRNTHVYQFHGFLVTLLLSGNASKGYKVLRGYKGCDCKSGGKTTNSMRSPPTIYDRNLLCALLFLWRVNHCNITQSYIFLESQKDYYYYTVGLS